MEVVSVPDNIQISLKSLKVYLSINYNIEVRIDEVFIKEIIGNDSSYKINKKGNNKNVVSVTKKRSNKKEKEYIKIHKNKYLKENNKINIVNDFKIKKCTSCSSHILKFAVERIINIKYSTNIKCIYENFLIEKNSHNLVSRLYNSLTYSYINVSNFIKGMRLQLMKIYEQFCYHKNDKNVIINTTDYEILLNKLLKTVPEKEFVDLL